jgi:excisionase family DNA binding protein
MVEASPSTVLSWVDRGWLPAHRTPGGHRRIERQALVEFLRAHDMPELAPETEPFRLLIALRTSEEARRLADVLRTSYPDLRVDVTEGVVEMLAHLFDSPPDGLLVDATLAGIDIHVLCRELGNCSISSRVRVVVVRPQSMLALDELLREVGVWAVLDNPVSQEKIADCLSLGNAELARSNAS